MNDKKAITVASLLIIVAVVVLSLMGRANAEGIEMRGPGSVSSSPYFRAVCFVRSLPCIQTNGQSGLMDDGTSNVQLYAAGAARLQISNSTGTIVANTLTIPSNGANITLSTGGYQARNATATLDIGTAGNNFFTVDAATATVTTVFAATIEAPVAIVIPSDGAGTPAAYTLNNNEADAQGRIDCQDANGCNVTMSETSVTSGQRSCFTNTSANTVNFADTAGVTELTGAIALGQYDTLCMVYIVDRWVQLSTSNN